MGFTTSIPGVLPGGDIITKGFTVLYVCLDKHCTKSNNKFLSCRALKAAQRPHLVQLNIRLKWLLKDYVNTNVGEVMLQQKHCGLEAIFEET